MVTSRPPNALGPFQEVIDPRTPLARACFIAACLTAAAIQGWIIAFYRSLHMRDFDGHREVGRRFFSGEYQLDIRSNGYTF